MSDTSLGAVGGSYIPKKPISVKTDENGLPVLSDPQKAACKEKAKATPDDQSMGYGYDYYNNQCQFEMQTKILQFAARGETLPASEETTMAGRLAAGYKTGVREQGAGQLKQASGVDSSGGGAGKEAVDLRQRVFDTNDPELH